MFRKLKRFSPIARAIGVIGITAGLVTGVTFAVMQDTATLSNNTISSASADLQVSNETDCNTDVEAVFGSTASGFSFTNLVPGGAPSADQTFCLKNADGTNLDVTVYATSVTATGTGTLDKSKVQVSFTNVTDGNLNTTYSLAQLESLVRNVPAAGNQAAGGANIPTPAGTIEKFLVSVKLDAGAVGGSGPVSVTGFDFVFTGSNEAELL